MKSRARILGEYLEEHYSWSIFENDSTDVTIKCLTHGCNTMINTKFCPECGIRNTAYKVPIESTELEIEAAIKHMLGEE